MNETIAIFEDASGRTLRLERGPVVAGDQRRTKADTTRIRSELGWEPHVPLAEGIARQWEWASARVAAG
jgi:UDP-glucose 4-epimerase